VEAVTNRDLASAPSKRWYLGNAWWIFHAVKHDVKKSENTLIDKISGERGF
jgi:hypothetical protein